MAARSPIPFLILAAVSTMTALPLAWAQDPGPAQPATVAGIDQPLTQFTAEQLDQLVGSIALYPDPLVAQILPASTYPIDVVKAARLVRSGATETQIDQQGWDPSVKAVAHYPSVIQLMDDNLDWTQQLGQAFLAQPDDLMQAVQRMRAKARDLGNLVTTPQEQVVVEDQAIRILPASPDVVYVPVYEPAVVYYDAPRVYGSFISFGFGFPCGTWLDLDCDWGHRWGGWCYRPGWTWNHWRENVVVEGGRVVRVRRDFDRPRGGPATFQRDPAVWHRDASKPLVFPGRRMTRPAEFDRFRGREAAPTQRPSFPGPSGGARLDRGRATPAPRQPNQIFTPQPRSQTEQSTRRGESSRRTDQTARQTTPTPDPSASLAGPAIRPAPAPAPGPIRALPTPAPRAPAASPPARITPPARVAPAPVRIAPPPPAASRPAPPAYTGGNRAGGAPAQRGGGGGARGGGGGASNQRDKNR